MRVVACLRGAIATTEEIVHYADVCGMPDLKGAHLKWHNNTAGTIKNVMADVVYRMINAWTSEESNETGQT